MVLKGSVEYLNNAFTVTAKVIDIKTLKVIYYTSETAENKEGLKTACINISRKISESAKIPVTPVQGQ